MTVEGKQEDNLTLHAKLAGFMLLTAHEDSAPVWLKADTIIRVWPAADGGTWVRHSGELDSDNTLRVTEPPSAIFRSITNIRREKAARGVR